MMGDEACHRVRRCRRLRGGRSIDAPRTQAAGGAWAACVRGASIDRSARPKAGPASAA